MRFTILICTRNRGASLATTLAALDQIDRPGTTEVLVVDNGSTDTTKEVAERASQINSVPVRYLLCATPGKSAALNAGIRSSSGEIIAFTDDDALPQTNWLLEIDRGFRETKCDWVYGKVIPAWQTSAPAWYSHDLDGMFALMDLGPRPFLADRSSVPFYGVNCAAKREAVTSLGGYRIDLGPRELNGPGGEDTDMFNRAIDAGQRVRYDPAVVVAHVISGERTTKKFHRRRMFKGGPNNFKLLQGVGASGPRWLRIPRYYFGLAARDLITLPLTYLRGQKGKAFLKEIHLIRFISICREAIRQSRTARA